jgi:hypothetical protein
MANDQLEFRKQFGVLLRLPIVGLLGLSWVFYFWWWLASIGIAIAVAILVLRPLLYPVLYAFTWLFLAFANSNEKVLPDYWEQYPAVYIEWCKKSLKLGFPTLRRWLLQGFGNSS